LFVQYSGHIIANPYYIVQPKPNNNAVLIHAQLFFYVITLYPMSMNTFIMAILPHIKSFVNNILT